MILSKKYTKYQVATAIAILFHIVGLMGILVFKSDLIIRSTAMNLLLSFSLIIWTQENKNKFFWLFTILVFAIGFGAEVIGVNTGLLFGDYHYGNVLVQNGTKYRS
ncbi:MAG: carotenoid biosynthesis protein [Chitinophagaceae bacterium]|nr:carotenoid biosynthesis protein [Chitinophagaceae bacterium]